MLLLLACSAESAPSAMDVIVHVDGVEEIDADSGVKTLDKAWIILGELRLSQLADCADEGAVDAVVGGPTEIDLLAGADVAMRAFAAPLCELGLRLDKQDEVVSGPKHLAEHSLLFTGTRTDDTPFELRSRAEFDLSWTGNEATPDPALRLGVHVTRWLVAADLANATPVDGEVNIDEVHDEDRLDSFDAAAAGAFTLYGADGAALTD